MSEQQTEKFETWGILELFGHLRLAGRLSEQTIAGGAFIRIDVPATSATQPYTRYFGSAAIYGMTPTSEETACKLAELMRAVPIDAYDVSKITHPGVPQRVLRAPEDDEELF